MTGVLVAGTHSTQFWKKARIVNYHTHLKNILPYITRLFKKCISVVLCYRTFGLSLFLIDLLRRSTYVLRITSVFIGVLCLAAKQCGFKT